MEYRELDFRDCEVDVAENSFIGCTFTNVRFKVSGGAANFDSCTFDGAIGFDIGGAFLNGLETIRLLSHVCGPKIVKGAADATAGYIRKSVPVETFTIG